MKFLSKIATISVIMFVITAGITNTQASEQSDPTVKIGLLYSTNAVPTTNLDNYTGSGHYFGYFDASENFVQVGETTTEAISILKNKNIYLGSDNLYYDTTLSSSKGVVGSYHIELTNRYNNYSDAAYNAAIAGNGAYPAYIDGTYRIRVGAYETQTAATSAISSLGLTGASVVSPSTTTYTVTETKTTNVIFQFSNNCNFVVQPKGEITWTKGYRYYGSFEYSRQNGNDITVVNVVDMQDYIKGVVPYEMSASWNIEALKAQALCARSYAFNNENKHSSYGFDLCNSTDCQVYYGTSGATTNSDKAVDDTIGEYITYNGSIATGFYHSSDGGATENSENVWVSALGYLRGVEDPYEKTESIGNGTWSITITNDQIKAILNAKGYSLTGVSNMYISKYTDMGNVNELTIVDTNGTNYTFTKERARTILNSTTYGIDVKSIRYRINETFDGSVSGSSFYVNDEQYNTKDGFYIIGDSGTTQVDDVSSYYVRTEDGTIQLPSASTSTSSSSLTTSAGTYIINGRGWGHNIGMSQYGAKAMADSGFTYDEIVKFYFTGVTISKK